MGGGAGALRRDGVDEAVERGAVGRRVAGGEGEHGALNGGEEVLRAVKVDGAVYGAMAGLGFATIENALYITRNLDGATPELGLGIIGAGGGITAIRALAGPGHVVYSAFAGYYLGLAKFNPENAGPIVVKGLLIAAFIHATYNSLAGIGSGLIALIPGVPDGIVSFFLFVLVYQGFFGLILLRKFRRYRVAYDRAHESDARDEATLTAEATEFE